MQKPTSAGEGRVDEKYKRKMTSSGSPREGDMS